MTQQAGVVTAIVDRLDDPRGEGRVTLKYKWLPGEPSSDWAPIAAPLSGPKRGAWFMPEKDDEVLVAFEQGDFDHPFIVGFLWNGQQKPPETERKNRVIVTPGGHQLRFEDVDNQKQIIIKTSGGHKITMSDASSPTITIESAGNQSIALDGSSIKLQGGGRCIEMSGGQVKIT